MDIAVITGLLVRTAGPPGVRTMAEHAGAIAGLVGSWPASGPVGLVAHSVASMIAVAAAPRLGVDFAGLFAIEGNLTADDAYFSGRAAAFDDPHLFKQRYLDDIWTMAQAQQGLRRYFAAAVAADPVALWQMGCDARRSSVSDGPGQAYRRIRPSRYYRSIDNAVAGDRGVLRQPARSRSDGMRFARRFGEAVI